MTDQTQPSPPNAAQLSDVQRRAQDIALAVIRELKLRQWACELAFKSPSPTHDPMGQARQIYAFVTEVEVADDEA